MRFKQFLWGIPTLPQGNECPVKKNTTKTYKGHNVKESKEKEEKEKKHYMKNKVRMKKKVRENQKL